MRRGLAVFALAATMTCGVARADGPPYGSLQPFQAFQEVRIGGFVDNSVHREATAAMASVETLSSPITLYPSPNVWLGSLFAPRFDAGVMLNTLGLTSYAFAGLNWRTPPVYPVFLEVGLGGAVNNSTDDPHDMTRTDLGCPVTFRESGGLGWQITDRVDLVGSVEHISHANLCNRINPGLTSVGLRLGYRF
jgi:lipid A 3-O-deacylase